MCRVDGLPPFAGKAAMEGYAEMPGGQVATAVLACARLGLRCAYAGRVGDDPAADDALAPLREAGVDVSGVRRVAGAPSQLAIILVDRESGERTILWYRDPRLRIRREDLDRAAIASVRALHLDAGDPEAAAWAARVARDAGVAVVLDADTAEPAIARILPHVDFPIVSRSFAEAFTGHSSPREALRELAKEAREARLAVVTLGESGALANDGERDYETPAFEIAARDTTGAGDAFHGGFVWALLRGEDAEGALRAAHGVAAMNCEALGAQGGLPTAEALRAFLAGRSQRPWREPGARRAAGAGR